MSGYTEEEKARLDEAISDIYGYEYDTSDVDDIGKLTRRGPARKVVQIAQDDIALYDEDEDL